MFVNLISDQIGYTWVMLRSKSCSFLCIFSKNCCTLFCVCTVLESSVYCNTLNIVNFYVFIHFHACLVQINAFGFVCVACTGVNSSIFTPTLVWRAISFLRVSSTNYCIFLISTFETAPRWFWNITDGYCLGYPIFCWGSYQTKRFGGPTHPPPLLPPSSSTWSKLPPQRVIGEDGNNNNTNNTNNDDNNINKKKKEKRRDIRRRGIKIKEE